MPLAFSQWHPYRLSFMAEMERFELSHGVTRLPHFECGPFNHLGTSPYIISFLLKILAYYPTFPLRLQVFFIIRIHALSKKKRPTLSASFRLFN